MTDPGSGGVLAGRVAIVTGANHGIGAATAVALAARGASVLVTYLRLEDAPDPGTPEAYRVNRAGDAAAVLAAITVFIIDRHFVWAAGFCVFGAVLTLVGLIHSAEVHVFSGEKSRSATDSRPWYASRSRG